MHVQVETTCSLKVHQCAISIVGFFFTLAELLNMTVSLSGKGWWYWINLQGLSLSWRCWLHYVACSLALLYLILPGIILSRQSNPIRREIRRRIWLISKKKTYWKKKHSHVSVRIHICKNLYFWDLLSFILPTNVTQLFLTI